MGEWKEEYAESRVVGLYSTGDAYKDRPIFHHVHPYVPGKAHCNVNVHLKMDTVVPAPPTDGSFCKNCERRKGNWEYYAALAAEQFSDKGELDGSARWDLRRSTRRRPRG